MTVHIPLFLLGLVLLWFPRQWMRLGRVFGGRKRRSGATEPWKTREPGDPRLSLAEFRKSRNYFDLFRAVAGSLAILGGHFIEGALIAEAGDRVAQRQALGFELSIVVIGLLIQIVRYERRRISFYAPIFYIAGLTVALCGPWAALFAFALVWGVNAMFGNAEAFLVVYGVVLAGFGILFHDTAPLLAIAALAICLLPVLLAMMTRRPLVVFSRKPVHGERNAP